MELTYPQDPFAVAVIKYSFCKVTGEMLNHTTGFGLERSVYQFYGHQACIEKLKNILL